MDELKIKLIIAIAGSSCFLTVLLYLLRHGYYDIRISFKSKKNK